MDSLLANYATSDEEEDEIPKSNPSQTLTLNSPPNQNSQTINQIKDKPTSLFSSLPKPKSSISQFSLPIPKSDPQNPPQTLDSISPPNPNYETQNQIKDKPTSLFSSLPKPTSSISQLSLPPPKSDPSNPKKVIQLKIPLIKPSKFDEDDDDDLEREGRKTESFVPAPSVTSFLSNLLPAAKNSSSTLGALPSALGSGRRSIVETNVSSLNSTNLSTGSQLGVTSKEVNFTGYETNNSSEWVSNNTEYESYDGNGGYENHDYYQGYNSNWGDGSAQSSFVDTNVMKVPGKRGRSEIPTEIVEVKQDDLTKNRPREDQVKSTGIAFGPSYQPVSTKGKPSKLQKRKHQIGSLYFDMRQKESELAERRSKGFLTKAETQAKYGW